MQEVVLFYNGLDVPTRQILDSRGAIPSKTTVDAKVAIQEMAKYSQKWHNGTSRTRSTETSDGLAAIQAQLNNLGREIKKVNEKVYAAQVGCEQCKGGGYRATASGFYQRNNANPSYQERRQSMEETLSKFMGESAKRHEENSILIKEIRASTDAAIRNQGASIKTLEIQIGQMSKVLQEKEFGSLPSSTETNPRDHVKSISTIVEADASSIRRIGSHQYAVSIGQNSTLMYETRQTMSHLVSGGNTGMRHNDSHCTRYKIIPYNITKVYLQKFTISQPWKNSNSCPSINSQMYSSLVPITPHLPLLTTHLKMILENVNNNVGELVGLTLNPVVVPII
ncbi:hypothetical protein Tco_1036839 [Tanacetum coccineum]